MLSLGFWQIDRATEKKLIMLKQNSLAQMPAVPLHELKPQDLVRYRPVNLNGFFLNDHTFLLDNRVRNGKVGYEVLTPFVDNNTDLTLLVNRGWIEAPRYRTQLPNIPPIIGTRLISGSVYRPFLNSKTDTADAVDGWPKVIQHVEITQLAVILGRELTDFSLRIDSASSAALQTGWMVVNVQPEKHTAYAVQWFAMSFALLLLVLYANSNVTLNKK